MDRQLFAGLEGLHLGLLDQGLERLGIGCDRNPGQPVRALRCECALLLFFGRAPAVIRAADPLIDVLADDPGGLSAVCPAQ